MYSLFLKAAIPNIVVFQLLLAIRHQGQHAEVEITDSLVPSTTATNSFNVGHPGLDKSTRSTKSLDHLFADAFDGGRRGTPFQSTREFVQGLAALPGLAKLMFNVAARTALAGSDAPRFVLKSELGKRFFTQTVVTSSSLRGVRIAHAFWEKAARFLHQLIYGFRVRNLGHAAILHVLLEMEDPT